MTYFSYQKENYLQCTTVLKNVCVDKYKPLVDKYFKILKHKTHYEQDKLKIHFLF